MITREKLHELLNIKESYEMPGRLMRILLDDAEKERICDALTEQEKDMETDLLHELFQAEHGDRDVLKQDFTPDCLCDLVNRLSGDKPTFADICAGTGGLTIKKWSSKKDSCVYCEEISSRAIPMLLLNLSIRNIQGIVVHGNSLTGQIEAVYKLEKGKKYSDIVYQFPIQHVQVYPTVIMNPPYSLKWEDVEQYAQDARFIEHGIPPKKAADYAFVLHGLSKLEQSGELFAILPHGVLFRGNAEKKIRTSMVKANLIHAVIGLPDKLFLNTNIPVCVLVFKKRRKENTILFVDAAKEFKNCGKQNVMLQNHLEKIESVYKTRKSQEKFSKVVSLQEIEENDYNLNIPRYVESFEKEVIPDGRQTFLEIGNIEKEIKEAECNLYRLMADMRGTTQHEEKAHNELMDIFRKNLEAKYGKEVLTNL